MRLCRVSYLPTGAVLAFAVFLSSISSAQIPASGVRARSMPADYAVSGQTSHATYAASLIPADQVKHLFPVDISKTYLVFEVACYPSPSGPVSIGPGDFLIKSGPKSDFIHPTDATTIAAFIEDKRNPPSVPSRGPQVSTEVAVAHVSGPGYHGTYTEAGVGVSNQPDYGPPPPPRPGSSPQDRVALENELADKSLPKGAFASPVAGYLYFPAEPLKKANGAYDLQHLGDDSGKVDLPVPSKRK